MNMRLKALLHYPLIAALAGALVLTEGFEPLGGGLAWAQDDDGGGDDGDDGGGGGGATGGGGGGSGSGSAGSGRGLLENFFNKRVQRKASRKKVRKAPAKRRAAQARNVRPVALPERASNEIVALGLTDAQLDTLESRGYTIVQQDTIAALGAEIARLRVPAGTGLEAARAEVAGINATAVADFNHFYRSGQGAPVPAGTAAGDCSGNHCTAIELIGWPVEAGVPKSCGNGLRIGMIDTGINPEHDTFDGRRLEVLKVADEAMPASSEQHGTAVAAILVGSGASRTPGLLGDATLVAVDSFHRAGRDERSDAYAVVKAMDMLASRNVSVINMSMSGPDNDLLEKMVAAIDQRKIGIVAAAGNGGARSKPAYPAAYDAVVAATAVDRNKRIYRRAVQGPHIDFSAPGVNVWTAASVRGARTKTGTSFAAPFVTAAFALARAAKPEANTTDLVGQLAAMSEDLGDTGRDNVFGHGLIKAARFCEDVARVSP